jgi:peptide/nickel transport system permease protein
MSTGIMMRRGGVGRRGARARRYPSVFVIAAGVIVALVCVAAVAPGVFFAGDPGTQRLDVGLTGPSGAHLLGTDQLGRDLLARTVAGARHAIVGPLGVAAGAALLGGSIGLIAGFGGARTDNVLMRFIDGLGSLPGLLVTIVVAGVVGGGYLVAVALLAVLFCPNDARLVRAATLELRKQGFVEAAGLLGTSRAGIMVRHITPNVASLELANALLNFAFSLVALASLSFLGIGVAPGTPDWGRMLSEGRVLLGENPAAIFAPAIAIAFTAASLNILGDWAYERFARREGGAR